MSNDVMSHDEAVEFFSDFYHGEHHIPGRQSEWKGERVKPYGRGWKVNHYGSLSTTDTDELLRLVILAHKYGYRAQVAGVANRYCNIAIHKRKPNPHDKTATWRGWDYHPTLGDLSVRVAKLAKKEVEK